MRIAVVACCTLILTGKHRFFLLHIDFFRHTKIFSVAQWFFLLTYVFFNLTHWVFLFADRFFLKIDDFFYSRSIFFVNIRFFCETYRDDCAVERFFLQLIVFLGCVSILSGKHRFFWLRIDFIWRTTIFFGCASIFSAVQRFSC